MSDPIATDAFGDLIEEIGATQRLLALADSTPAAAAPVARAEGRALGRRGEASQGSVAIDTTPRLRDVWQGKLGGAENALLQRLALDDTTGLPTLIESLRQHAAGLMRRADSLRDEPDFVARVRLSGIRSLVAAIPAPSIEAARESVPVVNALGYPLTSEAVTADNYELLIARCAATGVVPPPAPFVHVAATFDRSGLDGQPGSTSRKDLAIPDGYALLGYHAEVSYVYRSRARVGLSVGGDYHEIANVAAAGASLLAAATDDLAPVDAPAGLAHGALPVLVVAYDVLAYTVRVIAVCRLTQDSFEKWRLETHARLHAAFQILETRVDPQLAGGARSQRLSSLDDARPTRAGRQGNASWDTDGSSPSRRWSCQAQPSPPTHRL